MRRGLFHVLAVLSLALLGATVTLWARSHRETFNWRAERSAGGAGDVTRTVVDVGWQRGRLKVGRMVLGTCRAASPRGGGRRTRRARRPRPAWSRGSWASTRSRRRGCTTRRAGRGGGRTSSRCRLDGRTGRGGRARAVGAVVRAPPRRLPPDPPWTVPLVRGTTCGPRRGSVPSCVPSPSTPSAGRFPSHDEAPPPQPLHGALRAPPA